MSVVVSELAFLQVQVSRIPVQAFELGQAVLGKPQNPSTSSNVDFPASASW